MSPSKARLRVVAAPRPRAALPVWGWWLLGVSLLTALLSSVLEAQGAVARRARGLDRELALATVDSAWSRLAQSYYDTTYHGNDWPAVRAELRARASAARDMNEVRAAIEAMFARLGESHFALIPASAVADWSSSEERAGALGDVGLELRLLDGAVLVSRVAAGSAAAAAGVQPGWEVSRIGETDVTAFLRERLAVPAGSARRLAELQVPLSLMSRTQGTAGTTLRVQLRDGVGHGRSVSLVRRPVTGDVVRFGHLPPQLVRFETERFADARGCVGVVRFNVWMTPVMPQFDDAMVAFQHCRGVVIDLRGNVGGVAAMVMGMGGYLVDSVTSLGTVTTRASTLRYVTNPRRSDRLGRPLAPYAGAVAVLVDRLSVSTSEMFAAGLQVLGRARIFGEPSAGQALPAMLAQLPNGDVMQYVVGDFTAPGGRRIEARGVVPDERTPLSRGGLLTGRDETLLAALAWMDGRGSVTTAPPGVSLPRR